MKPRTIIELLRTRADAAGDRLAIRFKVGDSAADNQGGAPAESQ